jgi:hypothetical protein
VPRMTPACVARFRKCRRAQNVGAHDRALERFGQAKIEQLDCSVGSNFYVRRLHVAMDDAALVRVFQGFANLFCDRQRFVDRHRPCAKAIGQRLTLDELHDQPGLVGILEAVNGCDVWMIE